MKMNKHSPEVTRHGIFDMQVCVPEGWSDEEVTAFANSENPCGTSGGWSIRRRATLLNGDPYRNPCRDRKGFVHIMLDA